MEDQERESDEQIYIIKTQTMAIMHALVRKTGVN